MAQQLTIDGSIDLNVESATVTDERLTVEASVIRGGPGAGSSLSAVRDLAALPTVQELEEGRGRWQLASRQPSRTISPPSEWTDAVRGNANWYVRSYGTTQEDGQQHRLSLTLQRETPRATSVSVARGALNGGSRYEFSTRNETFSYDEVSTINEAGEPTGTRWTLSLFGLTSEQLTWWLSRLGRTRAIVEREVENARNEIVDRTGGGQSVVVNPPAGSSLPNEELAVDRIEATDSAGTGDWELQIELKRADVLDANGATEVTASSTGTTIDTTDHNQVKVTLRGAAGRPQSPSLPAAGDEVGPQSKGAKSRSWVDTTGKDSLVIYAPDGKLSKYDGGDHGATGFPAGGGGAVIENGDNSNDIAFAGGGGSPGGLDSSESPPQYGGGGGSPDGSGGPAYDGSCNTIADNAGDTADNAGGALLSYIGGDGGFAYETATDAANCGDSAKLGAGQDGTVDVLRGSELIQNFDDGSVVDTRQPTTVVTKQPARAVLPSRFHRWQLDDIATGTATDVVGGADGTVNGVATESGNWQGGTGGDGDGNSDYIATTTLGSFGRTLNLESAVGVTVETNENAGVIAGVDDTGASGNMAFVVFFGGVIGNVPDGQPALYLQDKNGNDALEYSDTSINDGNKHRVLINKTGVSATSANFYIDNSQSTTTTDRANGFTNDLQDFTDELYLFARNDAGTDKNHTDARLDDIILYDKSLTTSEIEIDYEAQPWT